MRKSVAIAFVVALAFSANFARAGSSAEPPARQTQVQEQQTLQQPTPTRTAAKDPNYRFRDGQWFYHFPQTGVWKVWDGKQWNNVSAAQTRTFSFEQPAETEFDTSVNNTYRTYDNYYSYPSNRIIGSFGFRGAGSKVEGRY